MGEDVSEGPVGLTGGAEGGRLGAGRDCWRFSATVPAPGRATFKAAAAGWKSSSLLPSGNGDKLLGRREVPQRPGGAHSHQAFSAGQQWRRLAGGPAKTMGMPCRCLRSAAELAVLMPCGASGSGTEERAAKMSQGEPAPSPVLWSTQWCPARHGKDSCPKVDLARGFCHSWKPLRRIRVAGRKGSGSGGVPGRCDHPAGPGGRSCSHAQGTADRAPALWSGRNFSTPGRIGTGPQGGFAFLCSIEQGPLPGLLWAVLGK